MKLSSVRYLVLPILFSSSGWASFCGQGRLLETIAAELNSPQRLHNCDVEFQSNADVYRGQSTKFVQFFATDRRNGNQMGLDLWENQQCEFLYSSVRHTYTFTDSRRIGEGDYLRQLILKMGKNHKIRSLLLRSFRRAPYELTEQVVCKSNFSGGQID